MNQKRGLGYYSFKVRGNYKKQLQSENIDMKSKQTVKIVVTIVAASLAILHLLFPMINIDLITVSLLALAVIPWVETLFKSVELPGGLKLEFQELRKIEEEAQKVGLISSEHVKKERGEEEAVSIPQKLGQ